MGCNGYIQGWEVLILDPFRRSDAFLSQEQFDDCISSICLLHSCPVSRKLDLKPIINTCFQSRHPELAAVLLPFVNDNDATFILQVIYSFNYRLCLMNSQKSPLYLFFFFYFIRKSDRRPMLLKSSKTFALFRLDKFSPFHT